MGGRGGAFMRGQAGGRASRGPLLKAKEGGPQEMGEHRRAPPGP